MDIVCIIYVVWNTDKVVILIGGVAWRDQPWQHRMMEQSLVRMVVEDADAYWKPCHCRGGSAAQQHRKLKHQHFEPSPPQRLNHI